MVRISLSLQKIQDELVNTAVTLGSQKEQGELEEVKDMLKLLIEKGANPNTKNNQKQSPLNILQSDVEMTTVFLDFIADNTVDLHPDSLFVEDVLNNNDSALDEDSSISYYVIIFDSLGEDSRLTIEQKLRVSKRAKKIDKTVFEICRNSKNPVFHLVQAAGAMDRRSLKTPMLRDDFDSLKSTFLKLVNAMMNINEMDDIRNTLQVLGSNIYESPSKFLEKGPLALALKLKLSEVVALPQSQEALKLAWGSDRFFNALQSHALEWDTSIYAVDEWSFDMYRKIPCVCAFVSFIFRLIFLLITFGVLFADNNLAMRITLIVIFLGYFVQELQEFFFCFG